MDPNVTADFFVWCFQSPQYNPRYVSAKDGVGGQR